jgi:hypothetical protein
LVYQTVPANVVYQVPSGADQYYHLLPSAYNSLPVPVSNYQKQPAPAVLPATSAQPEATAIAQPAIVTALPELDPALLNAPAGELVDTALAALNQKLPDVNKFFNSLGSNRLVHGQDCVRGPDRHLPH